MRLAIALALLALTAAAPDDNRLVIAFASGSHALSPVARAQLDLAAGLYRDAHPHVMFAAGHSDATGGEFGNLVLSARRGMVVKQALMARGVPADRLLVRALGASELADPGAPAGAQNRRAVVTWR